MSYSIAQYHSDKLRILIAVFIVHLKGFVRGEGFELRIINYELRWCGYQFLLDVI